MDKQQYLQELQQQFGLTDDEMDCWNALEHQMEEVEQLTVIPFLSKAIEHILSHLRIGLEANPAAVLRHPSQYWLCEVVETHKPFAYCGFRAPNEDATMYGHADGEIVEYASGKWRLVSPDPVSEADAHVWEGRTESDDVPRASRGGKGYVQ